MCLICIDLEREKLTSREARQNLGESYTSMENNHIIEVLKKIWKQEDKEIEKLNLGFEAYMRDCDV
tara:strand:- start:661 stop:858 length:198 start_codon:yes stop_codon:yes gene_type:complete